MTGPRIAPLTSAGPETRVRPRRMLMLCVVAAVAWIGPHASAAEPSEVQRGLLAGNYAAVIKQARGELRDAPGNTEWSMLLIQALLATGRYSDADSVLKEALARDARSIRLRWLAREVAFANGRPEEAAKRVDEVRMAVRDNQYAYRQPADLVVFGRAVLMLGVDPKD